MENAVKEQDILLEVQDLTKQFPKMEAGERHEKFTAVSHVSFQVRRGEILGLLGESGCGKSTLAKLLLGLLEPTEGKILYEGKEIQGLHSKEYRPLRREIQMIFQNPFGSLDPRMKVKNLLLEPLRVWKIGNSMEEKMALVRDICKECGLSEDSLQKRPGGFSGGQLQRIAIARALLVRPKFLVADEIVSALDVPVQNQILELLMTMQRKMGLTVIFITHDLAVIRKLSERVMVMRGGRLLEIGETEQVLNHSEDPYIKELTEAVFEFHGRERTPA